MCQAEHYPPQKRATATHPSPSTPARNGRNGPPTPLVIVFPDLATPLLDLCYTIDTIGVDKKVIPISGGWQVLRMGTLKTLFTKNEPIEKEEWMLVLKRLINAEAPSAQPFRMTGKSLPGRGSGPRLTDRKHYK